MAGNDELVRAASEARAHATQALESLGKAHATCDAKAAALAALAPHLAADREALLAAMEALGEATGEAANRLSVAASKAAVALDEVAAAAEGMAVYGPRLLHAGAVDLDEATSGLRHLDEAIGKTLAAVEAAVHDLVDRTASAAHRLEQEGEHTDSLLRGDPLAVLDRVRPEVAELLPAALTLLETTIPQALAEREERWEHTRDQLLEHAGRRCDDMLRHAEEVAVHCATTLGSLLGAQREAREAEATAIAAELLRLAHALDARREELTADADQLAARFHAEQADLHALHGELETVRGRWGTFGFGA